MGGTLEIAPHCYFRKIQSPRVGNRICGAAGTGSGVKIVIPGEFTTLNDYISAERTNRFIAAKIKKVEMEVVKYATIGVLPVQNYPVRMIFRWYRRNGRTDPDNICFSRKVILDGLQESVVIANDDWKHISGFEDSFYIDAENPRVEIEILEA